MARFKLVLQNAYEDDAEINPREGGGIVARIKNNSFSTWLLSDAETEITRELKERIEDGGVHIHIELSARVGSTIALYGNHLTICMRDGVEHALKVERALRDASLDLVVRGVFDDSGASSLCDGVLGTIDSVEVEKEPDVLWLD